MENKNLILKSLIARTKIDLILVNQKIELYEKLIPIFEENKNVITEIESLKKIFLKEYEEKKDDIYFYKVLALTELIDILKKH